MVKGDMAERTTRYALRSRSVDADMTLQASPNSESYLARYTFSIAWDEGWTFNKKKHTSFLSRHRRDDMFSARGFKLCFFALYVQIVHSGFYNIFKDSLVSRSGTMDYTFNMIS